MFKKIMMLACLGVLSQTQAMELSFDKVIYGDDDRVDFFQEQDPLKKEVAFSTAAMIHKRYLVEEENGYRVRFSRTLGQRQNLCEGEKFADQQSLSNCTGFLVGDDLIATAGHCTPPGREERTCEDYVWVFDYKLNNDDEKSVEFFSKDQVYKCKKVQKTVYDANLDAAVLQLEREVEGRSILNLSAEDVKTDQDIFVIGYPFGIPLKISSNAKAFNVEETFFSTNLDTFKGNSGSPVFDERSGDILGILVRGKEDFYRTPEGCYRVNTCDQDRSSCESNRLEIDGEQVTKVSYLAEIIEGIE